VLPAAVKLEVRAFPDRLKHVRRKLCHREHPRRRRLHYSEIATELKLSTHTIKQYFAHLRSHLGSFNRSALPGIALCLGVLTVEEVMAPAVKLLAKE
jgi:hypothetical protein